MAAHLETIATELGWIAAGVNRAVTMFAAADQYIQRSVTAAARGGFAAMAANLTAAQQQLRTLWGDVSTIRGEAAQAAALVTDAPQQVDAAHLVTLLSSLGDRITRIHTGLLRVTQAISSLVHRVAASANRNPALNILDNIRTQALVPAMRRTVTLAQTVAAALADALAAQSGQTNASSGRHPSPPAAIEPDHTRRPRPGPHAGTASAVPQPVTDRWTRVADPPPQVLEAARGFVPRPAGDGRPTTGRLTERPEVINSGGDDKSIADDLEIRRLRDGTPPDPVYRHVEGKVAAWMRREAIPVAELVVDNTVCGSNDRDRRAPFSCEKLLDSILPARARLAVWVTRDGGRTWWRAEFTGTGEKIRK